MTVQQADKLVVTTMKVQLNGSGELKGPRTSPLATNACNQSQANDRKCVLRGYERGLVSKREQMVSASSATDVSTC
jgi:hypothetical protein